MSLLDKRIQFKPFEYPRFLDYMRAIRNSYWVVDEFNLSQDIQDFYMLSEEEQNIVKRAIMAIAQVEVAVKEYWGRIHEKFPKPEVAMVGYTFADSEVRHAEAYSELLTLLGLEDEFEKVLTDPVIKGRFSYLQEKLNTTHTIEDILISLALFTAIIENISLFSQFLILTSFDKYQNKLSGIANIIQATSQEESIHAEFGAMLFNLLKDELDVDKELIETTVIAYIEDCIKHEDAIIDWIYGDSDGLPISKTTVKHFTADRFVRSAEMLGLEFTVNETKPNILEAVSWFYDELETTTHVDFFKKTSTNYGGKFSRAFTAEELF